MCPIKKYIIVGTLILKGPDVTVCTATGKNRQDTHLTLSIKYNNTAIKDYQRATAIYLSKSCMS